MSWRARQLHNHGRDFAIVAFLFLALALGAMVLSETYGPSYTGLIGVILAILALIGISVSDVLERLYDPYHYDFHSELKKLIDETDADNKEDLRTIAGQLSGIIGNLNQSEAEDKLKEVCNEVAKEYTE